jgi:hypothetical protein
VIKNFPVERRNNILYCHGLEDGEFDIISFDRLPVERPYQTSDIIVLVRRKGKTGWRAVGQQAYYPTTYYICRLRAINPENYTRQRGTILYSEMARVERQDFLGKYVVEHVYTEFEPGRKTKMVKAAKEMVRQAALGEDINWAELRPGKPVPRQGAFR